MNKLFFIISLLIVFTISALSGEKKIFPGADEQTPSRSEYFSWINNTNEGASERQSLINLNFFKWMKEEYGMKLDIYAFDAGAIDGKRFYGSINSDRFRQQFPEGFKNVFSKADSLGIRLGIWGGPDGFGETSEDRKARTDQMVGLCRDYNFALFKFDAVCGPLRPEKENAFINMMNQCRKYSPDLILLNHRLGLKRAKAYATTFLWGGDETYIDVFMTNNSTAPHHRAAAISRGIVPGLKRLTEDHGVCISSCLDNWDDDLILQAFNRNLILSPQIYGSPWLLRDDEFPKLARIFNLHRKYRNILVNGKILSEEKYGPYAVSRGDEGTRLITLRNLKWYPAKYAISLDGEIGLSGSDSVRLVQIHPYEKFLGDFDQNRKVSVDVDPFRSALYIATTRNYNEPLIGGTAFNVVRKVKGKSILIDLLGKPGSEAIIRLMDPDRYRYAGISGNQNSKLEQGKSIRVRFPGEKLRLISHRKIAVLTESDIPDDCSSLYEATIYAADNNALEVRSLYRSGATFVPAVKKARDAFFNQKTFVNRGVCDTNLFDSDPGTGFWPSRKYGVDLRIKNGAFRLDMGEVSNVDEVLIRVPDIFSLQPLLPGEGNYAEISSDLKTWKVITYKAGLTMSIPVHGRIRYLRLGIQPGQIVEIEGYYKGKLLDRSKWRGSNLFAHSDKMHCVKSWKAVFTLDEIPENSYLSVAVNGKHGIEGAYAAARIGGNLIGSPDRAPSYPSNTWEYIVERKDANYTYYFPLEDSFVGKEIEIFVLAYDKENMLLNPEVWISSRDGGSEKIRMELKLK